MSSKVYCGNAFLDKQELSQNNIENRIELEYYRTKKTKFNFIIELTKEKI